jgi:hypothetical protein
MADADGHADDREQGDEERPEDRHHDPPVPHALAQEAGG